MMETTPSAYVLPFGKYAGQRVSAVVQADQRYCLWLMATPFFRKEHPALYSALRRGIAKQLAAEVEEERRQAEFAARRAVDPANNPFRVLSVAQLRALDSCDLV